MTLAPPPRPFQRLTESDLADIRALVPKHGLTYTARWIGCCRDTVREHARKMGVVYRNNGGARPRGGEGLTAEQLDVIRLQVPRIGYMGVARIIRCHYSTVRYHARKFGVASPIAQHRRVA